MALSSSDGWIREGANLLLFGPHGAGKSHLAAAMGLALIENGWRVLFMGAADLVQRLQVARRELALESAIAGLEKYRLLILDDIASVSKDQAETGVAANQPFCEWGRVVPEQAMTLAAVDRRVHHATILTSPSLVKRDPFM